MSWGREKRLTELMFDLGLENKPEFNSSERGSWPRELHAQRHGGMTVRSVLKKSSVATHLLLTISCYHLVPLFPGKPWV